MNGLRSEYIIDLELQDHSKEAIKSLEKGLKSVGDYARQTARGMDMSEGLAKAQDAAKGMISQLQTLAKSSEIDFDALIKSYSRSSQKAISDLEGQYALIKDSQREALDLQEELDMLTREGSSDDKKLEVSTKLAKLYEKLKISSISELDARIKQNREIRASLKAAETMARHERESAKYDKLKELQNKRKAATDKAEKKRLDEQIKQQKLYIKGIEEAQKATQKMGDSASKVAKAWDAAKKALDGVGKATQLAYHATGLVGGAARTVKAGVGLVKGAFSAVSGAADRAVERERQANRVKGIEDPEERAEILQRIYIQTGRDYGEIVDAINRTQSVLGSALPVDELVTASSIELKYPGMAASFASEGSSADLGQFQRHAARMRAAQRATGATDEQIQASTEMVANMRPGDFKSASSTEMQAIYLGLQGSGAFDTQEELDKAFKKFVDKQKNSGENIFSAAQSYDWTKGISDERDKMQARTALGNVDWEKIGEALAKGDEEGSQKPTKAEEMAIKLREMEEKKNELLMKLIPAAMPIVEKIADLISGPAGSKIVDGLVNLFEAVIPALEPIVKLLEPVLRLVSSVLGWLSETVIPKLLAVFDALSSVFGSGDSSGYAMSQNANGGIVWAPSIAGERGPEAIIPLDYSRAQRAENIAYHVQNNFSMSGSETSALALAQAVSSRDFTRAFGHAAYKSARMGSF